MDHRPPHDVSAVLVKKPHARYADARKKAHDINVTLKGAQKEYAQQLSTIIKKLQKQFYAKYGDNIQELEDLEEAIAHIQHTGMKSLKRQLMKMYVDSDEMGPDGERALREQAQQLCKQYAEQYTPDDEYQRFKDNEAAELRAAITGSFRMAGGPGHIVQANTATAPLSLGSVIESDDEDE